MYKKVNNQWVAMDGSFNKEIAKSKTDIVSLFSRKVNEIAHYTMYLNGRTFFPGDMLWSYYLCKEIKGAFYIVASNVTVATALVGCDTEYLRSVIKHSENAVIRGFYYFKRTGNRAVMKELTFEEIQKIAEE